MDLKTLNYEPGEWRFLLSQWCSLQYATLGFSLTTHKMRILNFCLYVSQKLGVKINTKSAWKAKQLLYCIIVLLLLLLIYLDNEFPLV